jgi:predicted molibdopterin-dependent oxidoreductase YjgC
MRIEFHSALSSVENIIDTLKNKQGAFLPILHRIKKEIGYIPPEETERIANKLPQSSAETHGVTSFYHQFRISPASEHKTQVCRAGDTVLRAKVSSRIQSDVFYTTFHHPLSGANVITTNNSDWATNCPEYKVTAIQVEKVTSPSLW